MKSTGKRAKSLIVVATIALVLVPVARHLFPGEIARWYLAAAANAITAGDQGVAGDSLKKAVQWNPQLEKDFDYWLFRYLQVPDNRPEEQLSLYAEASKAVARFRSLGSWIANDLAENGYFDVAVKALELMHVDNPAKEPGDLNNLAYFRALSAKDLDKALQEINRALKDASDIPGYRDTRAWVFYQMGRLTEALDDANFAVEAEADRYDKLAKTKDLKESVSREKALAAAARKPPQPAPHSTALPTGGEENVLTKTQADQELWSLSVLRYHRGKILESLGKQVEAERDFQWLRDRRLPVDDRLY